MSDAAATGPGISVMVPCFNAGEFLDEAVEGALTQMRADDELLIQDGGSTDGAIERIQEKFASYPQLKVASGPDGGQADALNLALARASNPVVGWLNADDKLYPGALDAVRRAWIAAPDVDVVYGSWTIFDPQGEIVRQCVPVEFTLSGLMWRPTVFSGALFFRAATIRDVGGFDASLYFCMDLDLVMRLAGRDNSVGVPETLAGFRWHTASKTGAMDFGVVRECWKTRLKYAKEPRIRAKAYAGGMAHFTAYLATPLRRAEWYSKARVKVGSGLRQARG